MGWTVTINPEFKSDEALVGFINAVPWNFDTGGDLIYQDRNIIKCFDTGSTSMPRIVIKKFKPLGSVKGVVYNYFRTTKAFRAYHNALKLEERGVKTPKPLAFMEHRSNGKVTDCYYMTAEVSLNPIRDGLWTMENFNDAMAHDFANFAAHLHTLGILHHDLNCTNVLYRTSPGGGFNFELIDINRMTFLPVGEIPELKECMKNITRFTIDPGVFRRVAQYYIDARGLAPATADEFNRAKSDFDAHRRRKGKIKRFLGR